MEAPLSSLVVPPDSLVVIERRIEQLLQDTGARYALLSDSGGQLICARGETAGLDTAGLAALIAASFAAARHIARLLHEPQFQASFQQGEQFHLLTSLVGSRCVLSVGFDTVSRLGLVKVLAGQASTDLAHVLDLPVPLTVDQTMNITSFKAAATETIEILFRDARSERSG